MNTPSNVSEAGERAVIELIRRRLPSAPAWLRTGIGDDAAVVDAVRNQSSVLTTDALVEGIHFDRRFTPPSAIGHRAMAANLSDLAAMGAEPRCVLLSLVLPGTLTLCDLEAIIDGLLRVATPHGAHLIGGNITRSPGPLMIDVTAVGAVHPRRVLTRAGAASGDGVYVSGLVGAAAAGLEILAADTPDTAAYDPCAGAYLAPEPRVRLGMLLGRNRAATACVDLSDGLADGVIQLASASGVGMTIDADTLPIPEQARRWWTDRGSDPIARAVSGGDDYELLFTAAPRHRGRLFSAIRQSRGLMVTRIGTVTREPGVWLRRSDGVVPLTGGYEHFR